MKRETIFSTDRIWRYTLWREWTDDLFVNRTKPGFVQFIGLNPSTADETKDDHTIRRCRNFARRWGYLAMCMTNLFAFRATDPRAMLKAADPVGPQNDKHLVNIAHEADLIVCCWTALGNHQQRTGGLRRDVEVKYFLKSYAHKMRVFGLTASGHPRHPSRLPNATELTIF